MKDYRSTVAFEKLNSTKRKTLRVSQQELIKAYCLWTDRALPLVIEPALAGIDLLSWAESQKEFINATLLKHGAIVFRHFSLRSVAEFEDLIKVLAGDLLEYNDKATPRRRVSNAIYTSTEYPSDQIIELHNECSYAYKWPTRLFFYCVNPAQQGGETTIADCRRVFERISPQTRRRFMEKKVMYVRNFNTGFGELWQSVFGTEDKATAEEYCRANDTEYEWLNGDRLRTRQVRPAIAKHPQTGEPVWFNQATAFHVSTLDPAFCQLFFAELSEQDIPKNSFFGDGSTIDAETLEEVREAYDKETLAFVWQAGDVLMLDNMLVAHGRAPFVGPRKVLVGLAASNSWEQIDYAGFEL